MHYFLYQGISIIHKHTTMQLIIDKFLHDFILGIYILISEAKYVIRPSS